MVVFWLGIVDLQKYLSLCKEEFLGLEESKSNAIDDLEIHVDDQD